MAFFLDDDGLHSFLLLLPQQEWSWPSLPSQWQDTGVRGGVQGGEVVSTLHRLTGDADEYLGSTLIMTLPSSLLLFVDEYSHGKGKE